ncbi:hypothetical protein RM572_24280 [Streptomyces sp. DSM 42041]|uniref:Uncharacterized protein n=1 Tax=Streptomyces hazeniae TaxID=3075538 RepID=A0ABU2NY09_9ACTN|nr:hypothetical protein [Streptomyces sp. DSM 42041]MDT0381885.1 hypothetical protein [Streptomyces sp. DSM 42041]
MREATDDRARRTAGRRLRRHLPPLLIAVACAVSGVAAPLPGTPGQAPQHAAASSPGPQRTPAAARYTLELDADASGARWSNDRR